MFVIRTFPRCGTHMVRTALNRHPELFCHDEIFNPDTEPAADIERRGPEGQVRHYLNSQNTGCVIHAYAFSERFEGAEIQKAAWDYIADNQDKYSIIVLNRKDWVRRMASVALARQTKRWHRWRSQSNGKATATVKIHPEFAEWHFQAQAASLADTEARFPTAPLYWYEDLVDNWTGKIAEIQQILDVKPMAMQPKMLKQDKRPINKIVRNYTALRRAFRGSEWEHLFDTAEANDEQREVL